MKVNITLLTMITCAGPRKRRTSDPDELGGSDGEEGGV
jgi:hypothetical protein